VGRSAKVPDAAIFTNPLDYSYNPALYANTAYYQKGDLDTAMKIVEEALKVAPNATHLQEKLEMYQHIKAVREKGLAALKLWEGMPDDAVLATPIVQEIMDVPEVKTRVTVAQFKTRSTDSPWAIFFCGRSMEQWGPQSLVEGGIGGSETAVIHMAHLLAKAGWKVDVFNDPGKHAGRYGDVGYWPYDWYRPEFYPDLFVGWRLGACQYADVGPQGKVKWLWMHDLHIGQHMTPERGAHFDRVMGVSKWHSDYLQQVYPYLNNLRPTRNGIDLLRFTQEVERNPRKVVYASSPDRGLGALLMMWPMIVKAVPDAELHVYYGWQNIDKYPNLRPFRQRIEALLQKTPNVTWHGRLDQVELAKEFLSAGVWLYPTSFLEVSCITAMEAMAAGVAILTSECGALPETVGDRGILVPGYVGSEIYQKMFVGHAVSLLQNAEWRQEWADKGLAHAPTLSWEGVADDWLREFEECARGKPPRFKSGNRFM